MCLVCKLQFLLQYCLVLLVMQMDCPIKWATNLIHYLLQLYCSKLESLFGNQIYVLSLMGISTSVCLRLFSVGFF